MRVAYVKRRPGHGFFAADHEVLALDHTVTDLWYGDRPTFRFVRDCARAARQNDALYTIFASEHALVAAAVFKLWRRRVVIAVGGYDTALDSEHGYGLSATRRGWVPKLATWLADRLVAHSEFALAELVDRWPRVAAKATVAHLAVDLERWVDPGEERDEAQVLTVATVSRESFYRKGIDRFLHAAAHDPRRPYVLAGRVLPEASSLVDGITANVTLTGAVDQAELNRLCWRSGIYVQLSWHETFGMAMAEAMACGCTPVISDQAALVEVAGRWGVRALDPLTDDVKLIDLAADLSVDRAEMRADVGQRFHPDLRRAALKAALDLA
jgi:glycosyltransferase involved in cell wall biosynthesis